MKKYFNIFLIGIIVAIFTACNEEDYSTKEFYKDVVFLLSKENYNVYNQVYPFNNGAQVIGYLSIGCGGSRPNAKAFTVELENDTVLLNKYNRGNFDINTSKYARLLPANKYKIDSYTVNFPANNEDQYVKVPVSVTPDGLSPDSIYFIPLSIKSVSNYEVNPAKSSVLFRVLVENYYAEQLHDTYYQLKGSILNDAGSVTGGIAGSALVRPINKSAVRLYAGSEVQTNVSTVSDILKFSIVLTVDANNHVQITPYGSIQVEQFDTGGWNIYEEVRKNAISEDVNKYFNLYYRYRTVKTPATDTTPAVYNNWIIVQETLKRLEI